MKSRRSTALALVFIALAVAAGVIGAGYVAASSSGARLSDSPIFVAQVAALERGGLGPARAKREIEMQTAVDEARLVPRLEAALTSEFAGVWFEPATATLHVGAVSPAGRRTVEALAQQAGLASSVVVAPFHLTWAELTAIRDAWNRRLDDLLVDGRATTSLLPEANSVKVKLAATVSASRRDALARDAAAATGVRLVSSPDSRFGIVPLARCRAFVPKKAYCDKPIVAGVSIQDPPGNRCSSGPAVVKKPLGDNTTETFILTAGHCIEGPGEAWDSFTKGEVEKALGKAAIALDGAADEVDVGSIKVENGEWTNAGQTPVNPTVANWDEAAESEPVAVAGPQKPAKNHATCRAGQTTGVVCGEIIEVGVTLEGLKELAEVGKLAKAAGAGDSGGPFFSKEMAGLMVEGTLVGNTAINGVETKISIFESLEFSLKRLGEKGHPYQLLTTANETRPKCPMPGMRCFEAESYPATVTGSQAGPHTFGTESMSVECGTATLSGTLAEEGSEALEASPSYGSCLSVLSSVTVDANSCEYKFAATSKVEEDKYKGTVDIVCPGAGSIAITSTCGCTVNVGSQTALGTVEYEDATSASPHNVSVKLSVSGLSYTEGSGCKTPGTRSNGTYSGEFTLEADTEGGSPQGFWVSG